MSDFLVDHAEGKCWSYDDLLHDLNELQTVTHYIYEKSAYPTLLRLIHSMAAGYPVTLLDSDFSPEEMANLGVIPADAMNTIKPTPRLHLNGLSELYERISAQQTGWTLGLFTSGTTGRPKRVYHTFERLTRNVRYGARYAEDVWGLAYNPTHIAGIQVFLQAFLNGNLMVELFGRENKLVIGELLKRYGVTRISATPTYYRTVLNQLTTVLPQVAHLTFGGERFDTSLIESLRAIFPNAVIRNTYASTEAGTLLQTDGETFVIPSWLADDIRISEEMELLVHRRLVGEPGGDARLTLIDELWYPTGDVVEHAGDGRFKIVHRKSELVNIGGYNVNPIEVEEAIKKLDGVMDAVIKSRSNKMLGHILVAEVVIREDMSGEAISKKIISELPLQPWKIPRQVYVVGALQHNRSGKKSRL